MTAGARSSEFKLAARTVVAMLVITLLALYTDKDISQLTGPFGVIAGIVAAYSGSRAYNKAKVGKE